MGTPRQDLINKVAFKVSERNYEAWRYEQGDPIPEAKARIEAMGFGYAVKPVDDVTLNEMVEGTMQGKTRAYYMELSDEGYKRLANAILKQAQQRVDRLIDTYLIQQELKKHQESSPADLDVFEAMKAITPTGDADVHLIWNGSRGQWSIKFWGEPTSEGATASQVWEFDGSPQGAVSKALRKINGGRND